MKSPPTDLPTLWKVVERLDKASIPYMLTGSLALNFYGHVRATNDIDIVIAVEITDAAKLYHLFEAGFYISKEAVEEAAKNGSMFNVIDNESVFKVDFIVAKQDAFSQHQFARRKKIAVNNNNLYVIAPEDLILSKLEWSKESLSEMQQRDIENIVRINDNTLDKIYLLKNAGLLGVQDRLKKIYASIGYKI